MTMTTEVNQAPEKSMTANLSHKLDIADRDSLRLLAEYKNPTPHFILKEAVQRFLQGHVWWHGKVLNPRQL